MEGIPAEEWKNFILEINLNGIRVNNSKDHLIWSWDTSFGEVKSRLTYEAILYSKVEPNHRWWNYCIWKWPILAKLKCFT